MDNTFTQLSESMASAVENAGKAVILVNGRRRRPASGVVYSANLILTADHVVEQDENISVILPDGREVKAEVAGRDASSDLALLRLEEETLTPVAFASQDARVGEMVLAIGRPSQGGVQASLGVVNQVNGPVRTRRGGMLEAYIRTDALPLPGFSGGALINAAGEVVGINTSGLGHGALLTIPMDKARKIADTLAEHGSIRHGYLGIRSQTVEIPASGVEALGREQKTGLLVIGIEEDTPAAESNLMIGDILVGLAGEAVGDHDDLFSLMVGDIVGQQTQTDVLRGSELTQVEVTVGERTEAFDRRHRRGGRSRNPMHKRHPEHRDPRRKYLHGKQHRR